MALVNSALQLCEHVCVRVLGFGATRPHCPMLDVVTLMQNVDVIC
jgi:hypothetical protein